MFANYPRFHWKPAKLAGFNILGKEFSIYQYQSLLHSYCYQWHYRGIKELLKTSMPVSSSRER
jgi:hypothetical protein